MGDNFEFWMVWNPQGRQPSYQHRSEKSAADEAERLASLNPGTAFYVLHATEMRRTADAPVEAVTLQPAPPDDDCPF